MAPPSTSPPFPNRVQSLRSLVQLPSFSFWVYVCGEKPGVEASESEHRPGSEPARDAASTKSLDTHVITLTKEGPHIRLWVDDRLAVDWIDKGEVGGPPHEDGYIGFRQMRWTNFVYQNFRVWRIAE